MNSSPKPVVFVASSVTGRPLAEDLLPHLSTEADLLPWWDRSVYELGGTTLPSLIKVLPKIDLVLVVLTPDDQLTQQRPDQPPSTGVCPRDNLLFELGLMLGALGADRVVYVAPLRESMILPSDLKGVTGVTIPTSDPADPRYGQGILDAGGELVHWLTHGSTASPRALVQWPTLAPSAEGLVSSDRGEAAHSILLVGNTQFAVHSGFRPDLVRWLAGDPNRIVGELFLNPHSPHAQGRSRALFDQASCEQGLRAYRQAIQEPAHPRLLAYAYDGPYRYSARALDLSPGWQSSVSSVRLFHSTHLEGIRAGFSEEVPYHRGTKCFSFYQADLLNLWRGAIANPPGHGVSVVARPTTPPGLAEADLEESFRRSSLELLSQARLRIGEENPGSIQLYLPRQWHITLTSLHRTGLRWAGPLSLTGDTDSRLPEGFPEFVAESFGQLQRQWAGLHDPLVFRATHLKLIPEGLLCLHAPDHRPEWHRAAEEFLAYQVELLRRFGLDTQAGGKFRPKHETFWPHLSIGMAFHHRRGLPLPFSHESIEPIEIALDSPIEFRWDSMEVVHYAYRNYLRTVGGLRTPVGDVKPITPRDVVDGLRCS